MGALRILWLYLSRLRSLDDYFSGKRPIQKRAVQILRSVYYKRVGGRGELELDAEHAPGRCAKTSGSFCAPVMTGPIFGIEKGATDSMSI
jgi:hypothetical protein